jgi:hypothetical protein
MKPPIAPCPFCFDKQPALTTHLLGFQVICQNCLATGPSKISNKEATSSWNQLSQELERSRKWYANHFSSELNAMGDVFLAKAQN